MILTSNVIKKHLILQNDIFYNLKNFVLANNRIKILEDELDNDFEEGIRSLKILKAKAGLSEQGTRDLLIEMGAKQKKMSTGEEGWTLK